MPRLFNKKTPLIQNTRREFLKKTGLLVGGITVGSIPFLNSCRSSDDKIDKTTTTPSQQLETKEFWEIVSTKTTAMGMPIYEDPALPYAYIVAPGCVSRIPLDRLYGLEHCWVSVLSNSRVRVGVTDYFQMYLGWALFVELPGVGSQISPTNKFASVEGRKMNIDVLSPVGGSVLQTNTELVSDPGMINIDPYGLGWFIEIRPDNLEMDSKNLLSPDEYALRTAKKIDPDEPVPLMIP